MPHMGGLEATKKIRALGEWCAEVPIIAVTADEMATSYILAGFTDVTPKPIDSRVFASTVLQHLPDS